MDLRYLAGFFDGEGCVAIYRAGNGRGHTLSVQITQNKSIESDQLLEELQAEYGGSITSVKGDKAWHYSIGSKNAAKLLEDIAPWLRLKRTEVSLALEWFHGRSSVQSRDVNGRLTRKTDEEFERDVLFASQIKSLKSRNS